jgi:hypothetical protein
VSQGPSGRIVVEIDVQRKRRLYEHLAGDDLTFKEWLLRHVDAYVGEEDQVSLFTRQAGASAAPVGEDSRS